MCSGQGIRVEQKKAGVRKRVQRHFSAGGSPKVMKLSFLDRITRMDRIMMLPRMNPGARRRVQRPPLCRGVSGVSPESKIPPKVGGKGV